LLHSVNSPAALPANFISPRDIKPGLTLITGARDAGKTRWCMVLAEGVRAAGMNLRGLISPAVMENGEKIGYDLLDLESGERRRLAYRLGEAQGELTTDHWQLMEDTLQWGNGILSRITDCDIFILDEVGPLELEKGVGLTAGLKLVDENRPFRCFVAVRPSLLKKACKRWPWGTILELNAGAKS
jgi:nucleoside-triphosphatase